MAIKANGKVLREFDGTTYLPFGSEYSILLKNLSNKRCRVSVRIDGTDVLDNANLIIEAKSETNLTRFVKGGNLEAGNSFKFIEKTAKVEKHRGNKAEDGLVTVNFEFEREQVSYYPHYTTTVYNGIVDNNTGQKWTNNTMGFMEDGAGEMPSTYHSGEASWPDSDQYRSTMPRAMAPSGGNVLRSASVNTKGFNRPVLQNSQNTAGVTAPGSVNTQKFAYSHHLFVSDGKTHTMTMQLKGGTPEGILVKKEITVKKLTRCEFCGTNVKQTAKFCHECGAGVQIV